MGRKSTLYLAAIPAALILWGAMSLPFDYFRAAPSLAGVMNMLIANPAVQVRRGASYGPLARQKLDIYQPPGEANDNVVALFFYGGGWRSGERGKYGFVGSALASRGITTVIADYRLHPEVGFPVFVEDAARAYRWTYEKLARRSAGAPARKIVLAGHSAGAHIAALLAVDGRYLRAVNPELPGPAGLVGLAGPYAFDPTTWESTKEIFAAADDAPDRTRPARLTGPGAPPALLMHGTADKVVKLWNMEEFGAALNKAGAEVCKLELADIGHIGIVTAIAAPLQWRAPVTDKMAAFMNRIGEAKRTGAAC